MKDNITIRGAAVHNLAHVDLVLPHNSLITFTGVSGSGKSSLAFDTIYAEAERRYVESLSAYARQFIRQMERAELDHIEGLSPSISIDQRTVNRNPRSTVGTVTEVFDYLRVLFARAATRYCHKCGSQIRVTTEEEVQHSIATEFTGEKIEVLAPIVRERKGEYRKELKKLKSDGYSRLRIDAEPIRLDESPELPRLERYKIHTIQVSIDRLQLDEASLPRLAEAIEKAFQMSDGYMDILIGEKQERYSSNLTCIDCGASLSKLDPRDFSFNSPTGMCKSCKGRGTINAITEESIIADSSLSISEGALAPTTKKLTYITYTGLSVKSARQVCEQLGFDVDTPWEDIDASAKHDFLWGCDKELVIQWEWGSSDQAFHAQGEVERTWRGVIPLIMRAYRRTKSATTLARIEQFMACSECPECKGKKLRLDALSAHLNGMDIIDFSRLCISDLREEVDNLDLGENSLVILQQLINEIRHRLDFLQRVGLGYITLDRTAPSLSGGEAQRIRLATQLGSRLQGVTYVLDEPSIGLHPRDNEQLLSALFTLRDHGNTVLVVEHDEETIRSSDLIVDLGPGAGELGGEIVYQGKPDELFSKKSKSPSLTGKYLSGQLSLSVPTERRSGTGNCLRIVGATHNNLKSLDVKVPLGLLICCTGVSGSGKSSLIHDVLYRRLAAELHRAQVVSGAHEDILGIDNVDKVVIVDQTPIGRNPRSNPSTYTKALDDIRDVFASVPEAKVRGYTKTRFTFNTKPGRCPSCNGMGYRTVEMQLLPDVQVRCEVCNGSRFEPETLEVLYKGHSIADVLRLTIDDAYVLFETHPKLRRTLSTLQTVGLGYVRLGQPATTLSGGESQRMKLAAELRKTATGRTFYILDEPTTGLHFDDIKKLLKALNMLVDGGNSVIVIEHNLDIIKAADWIIDLGPEGGEEGGFLVAEGTPEDIASSQAGHTCGFMRDCLGGIAPVFEHDSKARDAYNFGGDCLDIKGATRNNLRNVSLTIPKGKMVVVSGPSGSGKTSLVMDTIFAEGQRRFVESLSSYARQFLRRSQGGHVRSLTGLSPSIAIDQRASSRSPRSTVATSTEIYDYLRVLYANLGKPSCPHGHGRAWGWTSTEIVDHVLATRVGSRIHISVNARLKNADANASKNRSRNANGDGNGNGNGNGGVGGHLVEPSVSESIPKQLVQSLETRISDLYVSGEPSADFLLNRGVSRVMVEGKAVPLEEAELQFDQPVTLVIDRLVVEETARNRLTDSIEKALALSDCVNLEEMVSDRPANDSTETHSSYYSSANICRVCGYAFPCEPHPRMFSFNHYQGACPACSGLGVILDFSTDLLIVDRNKSVRQGAIGLYPERSFTERRGYYVAKMKAVSLLVGTTIDTPFKDMTAEQIHNIFYGIKGETLEFEYSAQREKSKMSLRYKDAFIGLIPQWRERMKRTSSDWWRNHVADYMSRTKCHVCDGKRLSQTSLCYTFGGLNVSQFCSFTPAAGLEFIHGLQLAGADKEISEPLLEQIEHKCQFLINVGLDYLSLDRRSDTLSGGESQRIRLASQLGSNLVGVLYCLDEPTIGLHARDTSRLMDALEKLRDTGNSIIVVEHDSRVIERSDHLVDMGPGAGHMGGMVLASGPTDEVLDMPDSVTGQWLRQGKRMISPSSRRVPSKDHIALTGICTNNLKSIDVDFPTGLLIVVTGVSGSGKSSLVQSTLVNALAKSLRKQAFDGKCLYRSVEIPESIEDVRLVDQTPVSRNPRSNPATYTKAWEHVRKLYSSLPSSVEWGFGPGRFSFNSSKGQCRTCRGRGMISVELLFLADVWTTCPDCNGRRFNSRTLQVSFKGKNIADILEMTVEQSLEFFKNHNSIVRCLRDLDKVGLGYLKLGQPTSTLSGGEAQRMKLASALSKKLAGRTVFVLDEPTTGLHACDVSVLLKSLNTLIQRGDTVVVVEHNMDLIKSADWIIDLGLEGGDEGGEVIAVGSPEQVSDNQSSWTAKYLREELQMDAEVRKKSAD